MVLLGVIQFSILQQDKTVPLPISMIGIVAATEVRIWNLRAAFYGVTSFFLFSHDESYLGNPHHFMSRKEKHTN